MKRIIASGITLFLAFSFALADVIVLKTGKEVTGEITQKDEKQIKINIEDIDTEVVYFTDDIDSVNGEKVSPNAPLIKDTPALAQISIEETPTQENISEPPPVIKEIKTDTALTPDTASVALTLDKTIPKENNIYTKDQNNNPDYAGTTMRESSIRSEKIKTFAAAAFLVIMLVGIAVYIFTSLCLQIISHKTGIGPGWLAWIPIAQWFLTCKIAGAPYWWLLGIPLGFIPYIGVIINVALFGTLWFKVAQARNKPGWVGVLTCFPLIGTIFMGYLAFSE